MGQAKAENLSHVDLLPVLFVVTVLHAAPEACGASNRCLVLQGVKRRPIGAAILQPENSILASTLSIG
jgi:hypothetical protein